MTYEDVQALPHIAIDENGNKRIDTIGNNVAWRVTMEDGYAIHKPVYGDNEWKTVAMLYPSDELSTIVICAESELDENAVINGNPVTAYDEREFYTLPESSVPADSILGGVTPEVEVKTK